jgi:cytochrome c peroxidase
MSISVVIRSGLIGAAVIAATIGFVNITLGSAIVGETRRVPVELATAANTDAMKAEYRRPVFIPFPKENPYTLAKAALGKKLYFDPRLSATSAQSCASRHTPGFGWGDGLALGVGRGMTKLDRRSPTIINSARGALFMWDGRAPNLEQQALLPIQSASEMNMPIDQLMERLASITEYGLLFASTFPERGMNPTTLAEAIATYERTVVSERSPFDAWIEGDERHPGSGQTGLCDFQHQRSVLPVPRRLEFHQ